MGPISCPETSVANYQRTVRNVPEQWRSYINPCPEGLKNTSLRIKSIQTVMQIHYLLNAKQESKLHHHAPDLFLKLRPTYVFWMFSKKHSTIEFNVTKTYILKILNNL